MLGYSFGQHTSESHFGSVSSTFAMDNVQCTGSETSFLDCPHLTVDDCSSYEGAGVICSNSGMSQVSWARAWAVSCRFWLLEFHMRITGCTRLLAFLCVHILSSAVDTTAAPVDASWGPWGPWGSCSQSCGGGVSIPSKPLAPLISLHSKGLTFGWSVPIFNQFDIKGNRQEKYVFLGRLTVKVELIPLSAFALPLLVAAIFDTLAAYGS